MIDEINVNGVVHKINDTEAREKIENKADKTEIPTKTSDLTNDSGFIDNTYHDETKQDIIDDLDTIRSNALSGASKVSCTEETIAGFGFTKNTGNYSKPSGGIPKNDLESDVQSSLEKANSALQQHQDISGKEDNSNKVTSINASSTNDEYPSAKCVYDIVGDIETLLGGI